MQIEVVWQEDEIYAPAAPGWSWCWCWFEIDL